MNTNPLPPHVIHGPRNPARDAALARLGYDLTPPAPPPDPVRPPLATIEVIDVQVVRAIDPLFPSLFPLWSTLTEAVEIRHEGAVIARIVPTDAGQAAVSDLSTEGYELLVEQLGTEDTGETSERWLDDGAAAMRAVLADMPRGQLPTWRGEIETRLRQAEAVGRAHGMPAVSIAAVTGRPYAPRKSLLPTGCRAKALEEHARAAEQAAAAAKLAADAAAAERARPKKVVELGEIIAVKKRLGTSSDPIPGVAVLGESDSEIFCGAKAVLGLELPAFDDDGVRALDRQDIAPPNLRPAPEASAVFVALAKDLRARHGRYDTGAIEKSRFSDRGLERAKDLVERFAPIAWSPYDPPRMWRRSWLLACVVRGCLVNPAVATELVLAALDRAHVASHQPLMIPNAGNLREIALGNSSFPNMKALANPTSARKAIEVPRARDLPSIWNRAEVGNLAVAAAMGGDPGGVSAGALLDEAPKTTDTSTSTITKKGKR